MSSNCEKSTVLRPEYDEGYRKALLDALREAGAEVSEHDWGMAGSQEFETLSVEIKGQRLFVEAETYIGLSLSGPSELVDFINALFLKRLSEIKGIKRDPIRWGPK
jgi:hypothetical protein